MLSLPPPFYFLQKVRRKGKIGGMPTLAFNLFSNSYPSNILIMLDDGFCLGLERNGPYNWFFGKEPWEVRARWLDPRCIMEDLM